MDKVTVKVMSHSCKMVDITDQDVSCKHLNYYLRTFGITFWCIAQYQINMTSRPFARKLYGTFSFAGISMCSHTIISLCRFHLMQWWKNFSKGESLCLQWM